MRLEYTETEDGTVVEVKFDTHYIDLAINHIAYQIDWHKLKGASYSAEDVLDDLKAIRTKGAE